MVAGGFAAYAFVVGESAWSEIGVQFCDGDVGSLWEAGDERYVDVDAGGVRGWEQLRGERDLGIDGVAAASVEEQREVPISFGGAYDRDLDCLSDDIWSDGDLGKYASLPHVGVGWAASGAEDFKCGFGAGIEPEAAYGDAKAARIEQFERGQRGWHVARGRCDLEGDVECCGDAQPVWCECDMEIGRLGGVRSGWNARAREERGCEAAGVAYGSSVASEIQYESVPVVCMTMAYVRRSNVPDSPVCPWAWL